MPLQTVSAALPLKPSRMAARGLYTIGLSQPDIRQNPSNGFRPMQGARDFASLRAKSPLPETKAGMSSGSCHNPT